MHIYIDETGDTGFKLDKGSSEIFCISLLIFKENRHIEETVNAVKQLNKSLYFSDGVEWKFSKTKPDRRKMFLYAIKDCPFEIRAVGMNKKEITGRQLTTDKEKFYNYTCKLVLQYAQKDMNNAKVIFDKCGDREFYTNMRQYFRKVGIDHTKIKEIKSLDSRKEIPLQVVDMIAGAIGRYHKDKGDRKEYLPIIRHRIVNMFLFPDDLAH